MNATTVQNVVTYNTIIDFDNPDLKLFPGMTAYITIPVANAQNTLRVPNGALRYKPDMPAEQMRALYQTIWIDLRPGGRRNRKRARPGDTGAPASSSAPVRKAARAAAATAARSTSAGGCRRGLETAPDKTLEPVRIRTGITDHTLTEVAQILNGQLNEGDELVTGVPVMTRQAGRPGPLE